MLNYAPVDRDAWRLKAFIDSVGRPATSRLLLVRPKLQQLSLPCVWALCNSPCANAYTFAVGTKRDVTAGLMRAMPVPDLGACDLTALDTAARTYLDAAVEFTAKYQKSSAQVKPRIGAKKSAKSTESDQLPLGLSGQPSDEEIVAAKEHLRALAWRVDAEVLRLYALPPELERELLDAFDGVPRVGVPFEQTRYIPRDFREALTLDDYLRITDEWEQTDDRRCQLLEKEFEGGGCTAAESAEFDELQRLYDLRRSYCRWLLV